MKTDARASLGWQVFEESNDAIFVTSNDHSIQEVNPFAQRMTRCLRGELLGKALPDVIQGVDDTSIQEALEALNETGLFHSREAFILFRKQASPLPVNLSISRLHVGDNTYGLVIARDVSERMRQATELERRVQERTEELRSANERLGREVELRRSAQEEVADLNRQLSSTVNRIRAVEQQAERLEQLRLAGQLASGLAHDINNLITPLINVADMIADEDLPESQRQNLATLKTYASDIADTVQRLREIKPVSAHLELQPIACGDFLDEIVALTKPRWSDEARRRDAAIEVETSIEEPMLVYADPAALRSIVTNLVFNAVDAIRDRGRITLRASKAEGMAVISVEDNGEGMTAEQLKTCRDPFVTTRPNGSGLGLSLCDRIAAQQSGRLELQSEKDVGTAARLHIPLAKLGQTKQVATKTLPQGTKFLIVEDNDIVRSSTQVLLRVKGMEAEVAGDATEAMELLEQNEFDVVLCDLELPRVGGIQLLGQCRERWPRTTRVLISGWMDPSELDRDGPAQLTFNKPLRVEELFDQLANLSISE